MNFTLAPAGMTATLDTVENTVVFGFLCSGISGIRPVYLDEDGNLVYAKTWTKFTVGVE